MSLPSPCSNILTRFAANAERTPERVFMVIEIAGHERQISFGQAWEEFGAAAAAFTRAGCRPGDVVLLFLPQGWDAVAQFFGAMVAGCVPSFMPNPSAKQDPERYWAAHRTLLDRIDPAAIVTTAAQAAAMAGQGLLPEGRRLILAVPPRLAPVLEMVPADPGQVALLQHSSGTTGGKKGVMLSHRAVLLQVDSYAAAIGATAADVVVSWLPLYHDMGLVACLLMPAILGQSIVLLDPFQWVARPATLFQAITRHRATLCWMPNFAFEHLVRMVRPDPAFDLASMRLFINCSEPCQAATVKRFAAAFAGIGVGPGALQVCYAMAEATFAATQHRPGKVNRSLSLDADALAQSGVARSAGPGRAAVDVLSAGPPVHGVAVAIRDADGHHLPPGRVGEVCLRAPFLFDGYFRLPDQTAARMASGWYATRDRGFMLDGELFVLGRIDDLLILNGRNVHAAEIEALMTGVTGLKPGRSVAFGQFNAARGTHDLILAAELLADPPADESAIRHGVRQALFEGIGLHPAEIWLVPPGWLVKTSSGKLARGANAEKYQQARASRVAALA